MLSVGVGVFCLHVYLCTIICSIHRNQKRETDSLNPEL